MELKNKTILVTGASGLVGIPTVLKCIEEGAKKVYAIDIKPNPELTAIEKKYPNRCEIIYTNLIYLDNCEKLFNGTDINIVLHIAGIKGSPTRTKNCPADYLLPMMMFNNNMIKSSFDANIDWFVYISSVGVYSPADIMLEDDVWSTMPSKNDWHPGWAKRMGELALDALKIQYNWNKWTVLRPSNIYGLNDNFSPDATVISSNIWKLFNTSGDMICWGDGSARRDFVFGDDVAKAIINVVKKEVNDTINFGCGEAISIKETIETMVKIYRELTGNNRNIVWDKTKPNGDLLRCLSSEKQKMYGILNDTSLKQGLNKTIQYYMRTL
jgi:GDP-L-fucose synthase